MKVAVLMSTYNGDKYLKEQIDSILSQQGDFDLELFIRDDGSTDNTVEILKSYEGEIHWISGKNLGPALSFLELLMCCKGYDFYAFADQDDYWLQGRISRGLSLLNSSPVPSLYVSNAELVDERLESLDKIVYKKAPRQDLYTVSCTGGLLGCTMIFNNQLANIIQVRDKPQKVCMHDFFLAVVCLAVNGKIFYDEKPTLKYRQHFDNVVGIPSNLKETLMNRYRTIFFAKNISISNQTKEILNLYSPLIPLNNQKWLYKVATYKDSFKNRIELACSRRTKYLTLNLGFTMRMSIIFGNK